MKIIRITILLVLIIFSSLKQLSAAYTKDYPKGYEADMKFYFKNILKPDKTLQLALDFGGHHLTASVINPEDYRNEVNPSASHIYWGIMAEKFVYKLTASITSGIYFSRINTYMHGSPFSSGALYFLADNTSEEARYLYLQNLSTASSYISIPLEGKYEFINQSNFGMYGKLGILANIQINSKTNYKTSSTTIVEDKIKIEEHFGNNSVFFSTANINLGFRFGSYDSFNFRVELGIPFALTRHIGNLEIGKGIPHGINYRFMLGIPLSLIVPSYN
ncbi:MAG: outer membrane beta-barrel protein [Bacteroidales bacterium]